MEGREGLPPLLRVLIFTRWAHLTSCGPIDNFGSNLVSQRGRRYRHLEGPGHRGDWSPTSTVDAVPVALHPMSIATTGGHLRTLVARQKVKKVNRWSTGLKPGTAMIRWVLLAVVSGHPSTSLSATRDVLYSASLLSHLPHVIYIQQRDFYHSESTQEVQAVSPLPSELEVGLQATFERSL